MITAFCNFFVQVIDTSFMSFGFAGAVLLGFEWVNKCVFVGLHLCNADFVRCALCFRLPLSCGDLPPFI